MITQNSAKAWALASRPKTLSAAWIPVFVASALAYSLGSFKLFPAILCLVFAALMQVAANFINDLFDFERGTDREDRLGPERACAQGWISPRAMRVGIGITVTAACLVGCSLLFYGGLWLICIGLSCVLFAFLYTTLLSYCGFGDILVLLFFGFVPVMGTYYVQTGILFTSSVFWGSLACGLVIDTLLVLNNYRDRDTDRASGKRTLIVIGGERFGRYLYLGLGVGACLCCLAVTKSSHPEAMLLPLCYLIPHTITWYRMIRIGSGKALNKILGETSRNMLLLTLLLVLGILL
ncbi:MAG: 1,4-dihydroxy-2-naphthoate octaprenyltransferase [Bacteroidaceae bacterium]